MNLHDFLHIQKDAVDTGHLIPCITDPEPDTWFDGDHERATRLCNQCPIQQACADYARTNREPHGTWGGVWRNDKKPLTYNHRPTPLTPKQRDHIDRLRTNQPPLTQADIAGIVGCTISQVAQQASQTGYPQTARKITPELRDQIRALQLAGTTHRQIAEQLGVTIHQSHGIARNALARNTAA